MIFTVLQNGVRPHLRLISWWAAILILAAMPAGVLAQAGMPDPSIMNGKALPAGELPNGTVTVRVFRESVGNNVPGQQVSVTAGGVTRTAATDGEGRAEFADLPQGQEGRATVTVDGEQLTSEPFTVPSNGGLRVILVSGVAAAAERRSAEEAKALAEPAAKGTVVLSGNSRILMEFQDDTLQVFYLLEVLNNASTRVDIGGPLVIDLPQGAASAAALEGSSQQATIAGDRVTVTGPFPPGVTSVQFGYTLRNTGPEYQFRQTLPVALEQVTVALQRVGSVSMTSAQFQSTGDVTSESGSTFILGSGPALGAGTTLAVSLSGLPAHSTVPRYTALTLAGLVIAGGVWLAFVGRPDSKEARRRLIARRDTLLGDLAHLEQRKRSGQESAKDSARRVRVVAELEQIYGELDQAGAGPEGGGEGVAA
ncbi:MAG: carboxypeptidase-like regulatory domain-containing protein [Vicinamibacterales bacterium]